MYLDFVPLILSWPLNELLIIGYLCFREDFWDRQRQTLQVVRRQYMTKGCFNIQNNDFGERSTLLAAVLLEMD